jgi:hypothetical protein
MDEEDIAVPSGSLNNRLGVVYGGESVGKPTSGNGWEIWLRRFAMRALLDVSRREKPGCAGSFPPIQ